MIKQYDLYRQRIGRLTLRQFQTLQTRLDDLNEPDRMIVLFNQLKIEIEMDEKESEQEVE